MTAIETELRNEVESLMEAVKAATGGASWDNVHSLYLQSAIYQGGLNGILEQWQDAVTGRYAQRQQLGITAGGEGFDGILPWSQDTSGYPRSEENGDAKEAAANAAYRTCLAWWYPERWAATSAYVRQVQDRDRKFHVLGVTPDGGRLFEMWIDADTSLVERTVERAAFETITRSFSDYRAVGELWLPFHVRISNGHSRYDQVREVQSAKINPPGVEGHLRMPPLPPPDFWIAGDQHSVEVPFQLIGNLILLDVSVNGGKALPFILDTGGVNIVTPEAAYELGLERQGVFWGFGGGEEPVDMGVAAVSLLEFGGVHLSDQVVWVYPFPALKEVLGLVKFGGLLGYEVFRRLVVQVDYPREMLTFIRPECFTCGDSGTVVPFKFHGNIPEVEGVLDGVMGRFDLDTGNTGALILNTPFVQHHGLANYYDATEIEVGKGAGGGAVSFLVAQAHSLRLGGIEVTDLSIALSLHQSGALSNPYAAGLVGAEVFKRFVMTFDYNRQQIIFEKGEAART